MKLIKLSLLAILCSNVYAQDMFDALRYGQENLTGTARFRAMGGAFGALGGDISSINVNPAGSVVANNNQMTFSITNFGNRNNSTYFGNRESERDNQFDINQIGALFVFRDDSKKMNKFAIGLNYENSNHFNNTIFSAGTSTNPFANYFLHFANGIPLGQLTGTSYGNLGFAGQQAFLGYESYVINPATNDPSNTQYFANVSPGNFYQENFIQNVGYNGKLTLNFAGQVDRLQFGANLNAYFSDFNRTQIFYEENSNNTLNGLQRMQFTNNLYTYGSGFSAQLGTIYRLTDALRIGASYESPTWFRFNDELSQGISTVDSENGQDFTNTVNPNIINIYPTYRLRTPSRVTGSAAYVFKNGLISFDYSYRDFSNMRYRPESDPFFRPINTQMTNELTGTNEFRVGTEYKIKALSLRAGFRHEDSPFRNGRSIGALTNYNAGLGYNFGSTKADLAYGYFKRNSNTPFFSEGFTQSANIDQIQHNITLSLLFEL